MANATIVFLLELLVEFLSHFQRATVLCDIAEILTFSTVPRADDHYSSGIGSAIPNTHEGRSACEATGSSESVIVPHVQSVLHSGYGGLRTIPIVSLVFVTQLISSLQNFFPRHTIYLQPLGEPSTYRRRILAFGSRINDFAEWKIISKKR